MMNIKAATPTQAESQIFYYCQGRTSLWVRPSATFACVHSSQSVASSPPPSDVLPAPAMLLRELGGAKNSLDSWPLSRPRTGSQPELTMSPDSPLHGAFLLCYFNSLVTVLNPRGCLTGGLGITGLTVNSSGVKGPGHCPEPPMLLTTLTELLGDLEPLGGGLFLFVSYCPKHGFLGIILLSEHIVKLAFVNILEIVNKSH